ncbi:MAG: NrsF family protein [Cypionkella sp.]
MAITNRDVLIDTLVADLDRRPVALATVLLLATLTAVTTAIVGLYLTIGPRPDVIASLGSVRFVAKFGFTLSLLGSGLVVLKASLVPGRSVPVAWLLAPVGVIIVAIMLELKSIPRELWPVAQMGQNSRVCLTFIPLLGLAPLAASVLALRQGAPTSSTGSGALAGLVAGGILASVYAAHCTDDSPLFVVSWYPIGIALLMVAGALLGRFLVRW